MFSGFSKETADFLWEIKINNNRTWYNEHKEQCKKVLLIPMQELANDIYDAFEKKHPEMELNIHMSRIYRDARRLYGRGPYKDYLWFTLFDASSEHWSGKPSFWFEIASDRWSYGVGCYDERTEMMRKFRKRINANPEPLRELDALLASQKEFVLTGEEYKKQYQDCKYQDLQRWYRKKNFAIDHTQAIGSEITLPDFGDRIINGLLFLVPFYNYFYPIGRDSSPDEEEIT